MKQVVIEIRKGKEPKIISKPRKVEIIFRTPKPKAIKKQLKTALYHVKSFMGIQ